MRDESDGKDIRRPWDPAAVAVAALVVVVMVVVVVVAAASAAAAAAEAEAVAVAAAEAAHIRSNVNKILACCFFFVRLIVDVRANECQW